MERACHGSNVQAPSPYVAASVPVTPDDVSRISHLACTLFAFPFLRSFKLGRVMDVPAVAQVPPHGCVGTGDRRPSTSPARPSSSRPIPDADAFPSLCHAAASVLPFPLILSAAVSHDAFDGLELRGLLQELWPGMYISDIRMWLFGLLDLRLLGVWSSRIGLNHGAMFLERYRPRTTWWTSCGWVRWVRSSAEPS